MTEYYEFKTPEEVITALSTLYFNLNELERVYYDMFINKTPMDVVLQRYNDLGVLEKITLANRAKDLQNSLTGSGSPVGVVEAKVGAFYLDTELPFTMYYKALGTDSYGWVPLWSSQNLQKDIDYLSPTGSASGLTNLDMNSVTEGILDVEHGGTGVASISGLLKGNGTGAFTVAKPGVDYAVPYDADSALRGIITYFPSTNLPAGWLLCNGAAISRTTYEPLYEILGTSYGAGDGSSTFNIPNLLGQFIRCWDNNSELNTVYNARVGNHTHTYSGSVAYESGHTHTRGTMNITGQGGMWFSGYNPSKNQKVRMSGALYVGTNGYSDNRDINDGSTGANSSYILSFDASRGWTGSTSSGSSHTHSYSGTTSSDSGDYSSEGAPQPKHMVLMPMIKY